MKIRVWEPISISASTVFHSRFLFCLPTTLTSCSRRVFSPTLYSSNSFSSLTAMDGFGKLNLGSDATGQEEEWRSQSKLLTELASIPSIDKAWTFKSADGNVSQAMFSVSQANLLANKRRKFVVSAHIMKEHNSVKFLWSQFPLEMSNVSALVPSPSGFKLLVIRNPETDSPIQFEIWDQSHIIKEIKVPQSVHGAVYVDGWFEGISWNSDETLIAYVAAQPSSAKPVFDSMGYKKDGSADKDTTTWKGQGEWEEDWGETYAGKNQPALFVLNVHSGEVKPVQGISKSLSAGQVVWAPEEKDSCKFLVFVGWPSFPRKLGMKYCYNRPCALYGVKSPFCADSNESAEECPAINLTPSMSSAYFPLFSLDGKFLIFLSSKSAVDTGAHCSTNSLHRIDWNTDINICASADIVEVVPVVQCAENGCFPGLYCSGFSQKPWLSDTYTLVLSSYWHSCQVILSVNVQSKMVSRISPSDSEFSWNFLTLNGDAVIAVSSSPVDLPQVKYGCQVDKKSTTWSWSNVSFPLSTCPESVTSSLSSQQFCVVKIPVRDVSANQSKGAGRDYEAILVSNSKKDGHFDPMIVVIHGGPHSVSISGFSKSLAFLSSIGFNLLIVNYRGSLGFGEEALQSLPGNVGSQDVNDVLAAIDHVIASGLVSPSGIAVLGGSHGGFLTSHLIGQAPDRFFAAAARNPVCNIASMVGITDIPDWCFFESYGVKGKDKYTEAPSAEDLASFYSKSPIAHISKVKTPTIFLIGAQDLRVPMSNGIQFARALREKGVDVKVLRFPDDVHGIERPQSDFESFLNIGLWFKKYYP